MSEQHHKDFSQYSVSLLTQEKQKKFFDLIWEQLSKLQFGSLEIVVHDSRLVQIEKREKTRF